MHGLNAPNEPLIENVDEICAPRIRIEINLFKLNRPRDIRRSDGLQAPINYLINYDPCVARAKKLDKQRTVAKFYFINSSEIINIYYVTDSLRVMHKIFAFPIATFRLLSNDWLKIFEHSRTFRTMKNW